VERRSRRGPAETRVLTRARGKRTRPTRSFARSVGLEWLRSTERWAPRSDLRTGPRVAAEETPSHFHLTTSLVSSLPLSHGPRSLRSSQVPTPNQESGRGIRDRRRPGPGGGGAWRALGSSLVSEQSPPPPLCCCSYPIIAGVEGSRMAQAQIRGTISRLGWRFLVDRGNNAPISHPMV
jgi:hypothetical protein